MINVGILYDASCHMTAKKPFTDPIYNQDYASLLKIGKKHGVYFYLASYKQYQNKFFKKAFYYTNQWQKINNIKLDVIFDKVDGKEAMILKKEIAKHMLVINDPKLDQLCTDKWLAYKKWPQFHAKTVLGNEVKKAKKFTSDLILAKPRCGSSGVGIKIIKKKSLKNYTSNYILQELIQGGKIFDIKGQHDFRVFISNGKMLYSNIRLPYKHKYLCNEAQGGRELYYYKNHLIPVKIKRIVNKVIMDLKKFNNYFCSVDFMVDQEGVPHIIELNSHPGIVSYHDIRFKHLTHHYLANFFKKIK